MSQTTLTQWDQQMTDAWAATRGLVISTLASSGFGQDADDVMQKTWLAANSSLGSFDPERGSFAAWIKGVAYKQARKHVAAETSKTKVNAAVAAAAASDAISPYDVIGADHGERVLGQVDAISRVHRVLVILRQVVGDIPSLLERSMHLVLSCDGDVPLAARRLGVRAEALRDSHRNILDLAQVIDKALDAWWSRREAGLEHRAVSMRELLDCLPSAGAENREWITVMAKATVISGGFGQVTAEVISEVTGWSVTYCRHGLARTQRLVDVALPLVRDGGLGSQESLTSGPGQGQ